MESLLTSWRHLAGRGAPRSFATPVAELSRASPGLATNSDAAAHSTTSSEGPSWKTACRAGPGVCSRTTATPSLSPPNGLRSDGGLQPQQRRLHRDDRAVAVERHSIDADLPVGAVAAGNLEAVIDHVVLVALRDGENGVAARTEDAQRRVLLQDHAETTERPRCRGGLGIRHAVGGVPGVPLGPLHVVRGVAREDRGPLDGPAGAAR